MAERPRRRALIEQRRVRQPEVAVECVDAGRVFGVGVDRDERDALRLQLGGQLCQVRRLGLAVRAPRCEQLEQHRLAAEVRQADGLPLGGLERERRSERARLQQVGVRGRLSRAGGLVFEHAHTRLGGRVEADGCGGAFQGCRRVAVGR
jgi:hypothetical protein